MLNNTNDLLGNSRVKIFVGEFGSGKTEIAINYAMKIRNNQLLAAIVDIDLVKPYFRARENRILLEQAGVFLAAPDARLANSDLPIMPQNLMKVLYDPEYQVIMDVGGGESAIVLAQLERQLKENGYEAYFVINTRRPFTQTPDEIEEILRKVESASRLKISGLISNTNIGRETKINHVLDGLAVTEEASRKMGIPIKWVVIPKFLSGMHAFSYPLFELQTYTQYPWMDSGELG
jgi:hypothetical protein